MQNKAKLKKILDDVVLDITPSSEELQRVEAVANKLISKLNKSLKSVKARVIIAGSTKKNTQLKNTFEIDVFVLFDYKKYSSNDKALSDILASKLKKAAVKAERLHGSRDYFQTKIHPYIFEIVPILGIASSRQAKNITDVSPLHAKWVAKKSNNKLAEIRLTKAFMSAIGIYGAESYVRGFSGYACEVLTIHYKSFVDLLKATTKWKDKQIIDTERFYKSRNPMLELNKSKTLSPVVLIDPVQPSRNVTAALNDKSFAVFKKAAANFLQNPSKSFFTKKTVTKKDLIKAGNKKSLLLIVDIVPEKNKRDVMGATIANKYKMLTNKLTENGFKVTKSSWVWDERKGMAWFFINKKFPSLIEARKGPKSSDKNNSLRFKKIHKNTFVKNSRLYARVKRKFPTPKELTKFILKQNNFKNKVEKARVEWH